MTEDKPCWVLYSKFRNSFFIVEVKDEQTMYDSLAKPNLATIFVVKVVMKHKHSFT